MEFVVNAPSNGGMFFSQYNLVAYKNKQLGRETRAKYYQKNKEKINARTKAYKLANLEYARKYDREKKAENRKYDVFFLFKEYQKSARIRKRVFELTFWDFASRVTLPCYFCGFNKHLNGLDRLNSALDYTLDNVVPCCSKCNFMKQRYSCEEFIEQCKRVALNFS